MIFCQSDDSNKLAVIEADSEDHDHPLSGYQKAKVISFGALPRNGTPLAAVQAKGFDRVSLFFVDNNWYLQELQWTQDTGWKPVSVLFDQNAVDVKPKSSITAIVTNESSYSIRLFYVPKDGNGIQSILRVGADNEWSNGKVIDEIPADGSRMAALCFMDGVPQYRLYYQLSRFVWREATYSDKKSDSDNWKKGDWKSQADGTKLSPGLAATVISDATKLSGWLRVYTVSPDKSLVQHANRDGIWHSTVVGTAKGQSRLAAFGWCVDNNKDKLEMRVYAQLGLADNKITPIKVDQEDKHEEGSALGFN